MNGWLIFYYVQCYSILFAVVFGIIRFKKVEPSFRPFIILMWIGLANEIMSQLVVLVFNRMNANANVYVLVEFAFILFQFYKWNTRPISRYLFLFCIGLGIWIVDNMVVNSISTINSIFRVSYSFIIVLLSLDQIGRLLLFERGSMFKNAIFLVCTGFLIFYGFKTCIEVFNILQLKFEADFYRNLWTLMGVFNIIANLIYALAILWMPKRREFILPF